MRIVTSCGHHGAILCLGLLCLLQHDILFIGVFMSPNAFFGHSVIENSMPQISYCSGAKQVNYCMYSSVDDALIVARLLYNDDNFALCCLSRLFNRCHMYYVHVASEPGQEPSDTDVITDNKLSVELPLFCLFVLSLSKLFVSNLSCLCAQHCRCVCPHRVGSLCLSSCWPSSCCSSCCAVSTANRIFSSRS